MRGNAAVFLCVVFVAAAVSACSRVQALGIADACKFLARAEGIKHVGATISFQGEYVTDHMERAAIRPMNCGPFSGVGVGTMDARSERIVEKLALHIARNGQLLGVRATFTGTLVQVRPDDTMFGNDTGLRLNVTGIDRATSFVWVPKL